MNSKLNDDLVRIVLKRNELNRLNYDNPEYDQVEEELHDMEDIFVNIHGKFLESVLSKVHLQICPDTEVMLPIAYVAKKYAVIQEKSTDPVQFDPGLNEGPIIDAREHPGEIFRLVLVPNPARLILQSGKKVRKEVWVDK